MYCENLRINQPLKVTFSGVAVAQSKVILRVTVLNFMQFSKAFSNKKALNLVLNSAIKLF